MTATLMTFRQLTVQRGLRVGAPAMRVSRGLAI